jgi:hypothetical protein
MLLKVVSNEEAFLEVGVEVVHNLFAAPEFSPPSLVLSLLLIDYAHGVRDTLANAVDIFEFSARHEKLDLVSNVIRGKLAILAGSIVVLHLSSL